LGIWQANGNTYVTWNTFGSFHDIELRGFTGDPLSQIRWYDDDYRSDPSTTGRLAPGQEVAGEIEMSVDKDWFRTTLEQGHGYMFSVEGGTLGDPEIFLRDASGREVAEGWTGESIQIEAPAGGNFYLEVHDFSGESDTGSYQVSMIERADDYSAYTDTTGRLAVGGTATGRVDYEGDHDWFRIRLVEGNTYSMEVRGGEEEELYNPYSILRDAQGNLIMSGNYGDVVSQIEYAASATGYYYLQASDADGYVTGAYEVSLDRIDAILN
jgi:hypothetical protein